MNQKPSENYNFFVTADLSDYENQWVAIADKKIVGHGKEADKVLEKAKKKFPDTQVSLAKVPKKGLQIV